MREKLQALMDEKVNPAVGAHGGHIEIVDYVNDVAFVKMSGGCQGCAASNATLRHGVERVIKEIYPEVKEVRDVTDHGSGHNPFY